MPSPSSKGLDGSSSALLSSHISSPESQTVSSKESTIPSSSSLPQSSSKETATFSEPENLPYITLTNCTGTISFTKVSVGDTFMGLTVETLENRGTWRMFVTFSGELEIQGVYQAEESLDIRRITMDEASMEKYPQIYLEHEGSENEMKSRKNTSTILFYSQDMDATLVSGKTYRFTIGNLGDVYIANSDVFQSITILDAVEVK